MLDLLEKAPAFVKIAAALCALLAMLVMETEVFLRSCRHDLFYPALAILAAAYFGFLGYGVWLAAERHAPRANIEQLHAATGAMIATDRLSPPRSP